MQDEEKAHLNELLNDLDTATHSSSSGVGIPELSKRTISRQITLFQLIGQGRFGQVFIIIIIFFYLFLILFIFFFIGIFGRMAWR